MLFRRPSAPALLGLGAAVAGLVGVVSALTPEFADRFDLVRGILPPGVPEAARVLALSLGLALIWLSRSLARRKRRAWQLAVALVAVSAIAHLAKGLDVEEASVHLVLLAALWRYRHEFVAQGDPETIRPLVRVLGALVAVGILGTLRVSDRMVFSDRIEEALGLLALALGARALYLWLRPLALRVRQTPPERRHAERLVHEHGHDSLAFFSLRRDKSYFFSSSGRSFLAYRVVNGCALVAGDPIGVPADFRALLDAFRRVAHDRAWRVALVGASAELLPLYRDCGLRSIYLAEDAEGEVGGFLQLVPSPASGGYSLAAMRRGSDTPNGLMESLVVETIEWARLRGASEVSLNFSVFADLLRGCERMAVWRRAARFGLLRLDRFFQLERLLSFNRKFHPLWRPRYICVERVLDFPVVGLAFLRVESLLTPPGPWGRRDLTAA